MEQYSLFKLHIGFNNAFKSFPDDSAQYSKSFLHENLTHFSGCDVYSSGVNIHEYTTGNVLNEVYKFFEE